jgi:hypothetical protein
MNKIFSEKYVASISLLWIVVMACLVVLKRQTLTDLDLNSIGDFLAGAFAPLGFFWLVAGFYQQGKGLEQNSHALNLQAQELQASTEALNLQVQEMRASVDQQKEISKFYKLELDERNYKARAKFEISSLFVQDKKAVDGFALALGQAPYLRNCTLKFKLINVGAVVHKVTVRITNSDNAISNQFPSWEYKETLNLEYELNDNEYILLLDKYILFKVLVSYMTENGVRVEQVATIDVSPSMMMNEEHSFTTLYGLFEDTKA